MHSHHARGAWGETPPLLPCSLALCIVQDIDGTSLKHRSSRATSPTKAATNMSLPPTISHKRQDLRWFWTIDNIFLFIFVAALVIGFFTLTFTAQIRW